MWFGGSSSIRTLPHMAHIASVILSGTPVEPITFPFYTVGIAEQRVGGISEFISVP
jgi:hypothetical protein